jgi:AraC-like DNA-binding protein
MAQPQVREGVQRAPAPALRPYVAWYTGYRIEGTPPGTHRGLPSPYLTLILTLDDPLVIGAHPDPRQPPGTFDALLGGLHTAPALITHPGRQSGVQLALHPLGVRALLGMPAGEVAGADVPLDAVLGTWSARVRERLLACRGWAERFAVLDAELGARLLRAPRARTHQPAELAHAWQVLSGGAAGPAAPTIGDLARDVGWSPRRLLSRFRSEIGLSPKEVARVARFDATRRLLFAHAGAGRPVRLAELAAACGYYDQAHLAREFRALAGCPPSTLLAEEFRFVHLEAASDVTTRGA